MKHLTRVAAVTAATALAAAGLVGTASTSANAKAATLSTSYTCTTGFGPIVLPVNITTNLPATAKAGKKIPGKAATFDVTVPADIVGAAASILGATALGGTLKGDVLAGATKVPMSGSFATTDIVDPTAALALPGTGKTAAFKIAKAGKYTVKAPKTMIFNPTNQDGGSLIGDITCTVTPGSPSKIGTIKITK